MKKFVLMLITSVCSTVYAQNIVLACSTVVTTNITSKNTPKINEKNKKDWAKINIIVDTNNNTMSVGESFHTAHINYPGLRVGEASYSINFVWTPDKVYPYRTISVSINRFDSTIRISQSSKNEYGTWIESEMTGSCQQGVVWQQQF